MENELQFTYPIELLRANQLTKIEWMLNQLMRRFPVKKEEVKKPVTAFEIEHWFDTEQYSSSVGKRFVQDFNVYKKD